MSQKTNCSSSHQSTMEYRSSLTNSTSKHGHVETESSDKSQNGISTSSEEQIQIHTPSTRSVKPSCLKRTSKSTKISMQILAIWLQVYSIEIRLLKNCKMWTTFAV